MVILQFISGVVIALIAAGWFYWGPQWISETAFSSATPIGPNVRGLVRTGAIIGFVIGVGLALTAL